MRLFALLTAVFLLTGAAAMQTSGSTDSITIIEREQARDFSEYGNFREARKIYRQAIRQDIRNLSDTLEFYNLYLDYIYCLNDYTRYNQADSTFSFVGDVSGWLSHKPDLQCGLILYAAYASADSLALSFVKSQLDKYPSLKEPVNYEKLLYCMAEICARTADYTTAHSFIDSAAAISTRGNAELKKMLCHEFTYLLQGDIAKAMEANAEAIACFDTEIADKENCTEYLTLHYRRAEQAIALDDYDKAEEPLAIYRSLLPSVAGMRQAVVFDKDWATLSLFAIYPRYGTVSVSLNGPLAEYKFRENKLDEAAQLIKPLLGYLKGLKSTLANHILQGMLLPWQDSANVRKEWSTKWASRLNDEEINALAYDVLLLTKQLTLTTDENIKRIVLESGDEEFRRDWDRINSLDSDIQSRITQGLPAGELIAEKKSLQIKLTVEANKIENPGESMLCGWRDVQAALGNDECAVEFSFYPTVLGEKYYTASILTKKQPPRTVALFEESDIAENASNSDYSLYRAIWEPITKITPGIKRYFFSPDGILHTLGIEYAGVDSSNTMSDLYDMCRISSSRNLIDRKTQPLVDAVIFGGIDYDSAPQTENRTDYTDDGDFAGLLRAMEPVFRSGASYLPGTRAEADTLLKILRPKMSTQSFNGDKGSETALKKLSGNSPSLLHIATHGFYWTEKEARRNSGVGFLATLGNSSISQADRDMSRSGILLSGANSTLRGRMSDPRCDGVVTAKEISSLDLSKSDLVVLSACQSALGEISGDGVFGLQRGLKMAGANTILMSLWKVDDTATTILMTQFYKNLMLGKSKRRSLLDAQNYLKEYEVEEIVDTDSSMTANQRRKAQRTGIETETTEITTKTRPYASPKYWAAFILLDALN